MPYLQDAAHLNAEQVADTVRPFVDGQTVNGTIRLTLDAARIRYKDSGYWRVPVRPSTAPEPLFPYYEALADIEDRLQESTGLRIVLATGEPTDE